MDTEMQEWARQIFKVRDIKEIVLDDLMAELEEYVDRLIYGDIESIQLCKRKGQNGLDVFYLADSGGTELFNCITLNDRWQNREFLRLYMSDVMFDINERELRS